MAENDSVMDFSIASIEVRIPTSAVIPIAIISAVKNVRRRLLLMDCSEIVTVSRKDIFTAMKILFYVRQSSYKNVTGRKRLGWFFSALKFKHGNLWQDTHSTRITQKAKTGVDIKLLLTLLIQTGPFLINVLYRTPLKVFCPNPKLHSMGMTTEGSIHIRVIKYLRAPMRWIVRQ